MKRIMFFIVFNMLCVNSLLFSADGSRHVLYISSYHPAFPTFNNQVEGIKSVFRNDNIILDIEFMDTKRFPGRENVESFNRLLSFKLRRLPAYDAVIVADDAALLYAVAHIGDLFKNIPVFYCGINDYSMAASLDRSFPVRGVIERVSISDTLELIRRLFPQRVKLAVITDGTVSARADMKSFLSILKNFSFAVDILSLENLTFDRLNMNLKKLGDEWSILLFSAYTDADGTTRLFQDELDDLARNSSVPVFHLWEHGIGEGILGGKVVFHFEQGRAAAEMVLRYLHGAPVAEIDNLSESPNRYCFDYNQLKKFNVSLSQLPEGSIVLNKPLSFYETHKVLIIIISVVISALLYIVIILVIESRRLRKLVRVRTSELAESEERWKFSLEGAGQVVWDWNLSNNKIFISRKWGSPTVSGDNAMLLNAEEWFEQIHPDDRDKTREIMEKHIRGEKTFFENFHRVSGSGGKLRWVLSRGKVIERNTDGSPLRVIGTATDITELKEIEDEISSSRRMLQLVLDTIPVGVFWKNRDFKYMGCNDTFARLIGIESAGSIVGKKDEEIMDSDIARSYIMTDREIISSGVPKLNYEDQMFLPTGKVRILRKSKVPLTDSSGGIIGILGTYEDVTTQKNLREETFRIQKLESIGILASGIAHDFNNLLMAISGSLSIVRISDTVNEKTLHWIEQAEKSCFTATELTTRLITFARGGAPVLQDENIVEIIQEAVDSGIAGSSVKINYINESKSGFVKIDGRQVRQVILNLIENSKEAMPGGGGIDIVLSDIFLESDNRLDLSAGWYKKISVKDTGKGIPGSIIDKIFDPYFSTKEMGPQKGQGLGLAICHSIVAQHGGKITVSSIEGKGTQFTIFIPSLNSTESMSR